MNLQNKNILLTGASGGIGQALALALAEKGARLWLVGRDAVALNTLCARLPHSEHHSVVVVNHYSDEDIEDLTRLFWGNTRLDVLINNAGTNRFALLEEQSFSDIREQIRVNVELPLLLTRGLCHQFNAGGIILNIGSILGEIGHPGYSIYSATKAALHRFSEALGRELSLSGLSVLYVAPRATRTRFNTEAANALNASLGNGSDTAEYVAQKIILSLEKEHKRQRLGFVEKLFVKINALLPSIVDRALSKKMSVIDRYARQHAGRSVK
ncbi:SDR family oxidoreductase [Erwinia sp. AnSW2-5]|uniref:SDR family oxidoreductase n=1 Tax=Erwinia sp. AnSW2-5 TaxID=3367692 RepID=UPI00385A134B